MNARSVLFLSGHLINDFNGECSHLSAVGHVGFGYGFLIFLGGLVLVSLRLVVILGLCDGHWVIVFLGDLDHLGRAPVLHDGSRRSASAHGLAAATSYETGATTLGLVTSAVVSLRGCNCSEGGSVRGTTGAGS